MKSATSSGGGFSMTASATEIPMDIDAPVAKGF